MHRQGGGHHVDGDAEQRFVAQVATPAAQQQHQGRGQVADRHGLPQHGVLRHRDQRGVRPEQDQRQQRRLEHPVKGEEIEFAAQRAVGVDGVGDGCCHAGEYAGHSPPWRPSRGQALQCRPPEPPADR